MRLLNTRTLEVEMFPGQAPGYAILSHTWEDREITFDNMKLLGGKEAFLSAMSLATEPLKKSYEKILHSADFARTRGSDYIWIDTCCIDKSSSAELSETINSMFEWYKGAEICYAYLADVTYQEAVVLDTLNMKVAIARSRWFTRGWTLQELIAPKEVIFVDKAWKFLGTKTSLKHEIQDITKVAHTVLDGASLDTIVAAAKMSWASGRNTTRPEDIAYCLLGLFNVDMPLLYGEGKAKAFIRLQEEFLKNSDDESIFAWRTSQEEALEKPYWPLLASTPNQFDHCRAFRKPRFLSHREGQPTMITNRGIRVEMSLMPFLGDASGTIFLAVLECLHSNVGWGEMVAIVLQRLSDLEVQYARITPEVLLEMSVGLFKPPLASLTATFNSQHKAAASSYMTKINESEPQYLFVRLAPKQSSLITGFYLEPAIATRVILGSTGTSLTGAGRKPPPGWEWNFNHSLVVSDIVEPWSQWDARAGSHYMIDFESKFSEEELGQIEVSNMKERKVLGCMGLKIVHPRKDQASTSISTVYFVVGLEPLPENPFGTPSGYIKPWYSFAAYQLLIAFTKGTRFSRAFYQVNLLLLEF